MPVPSSSWIMQFVSKILSNYGAISLLGCQLVTRPRILGVVIIYRHVFLNMLHWSQHNGLMSSLQTGLVSPQFKPCLLVDVSPLYCPSASRSSGGWKMHLPVSVNVHHPRFIPSMEFVDCFCNCKLQKSKGSLTLGV